MSQKAVVSEPGSPASIAGDAGSPQVDAVAVLCLFLSGAISLVYQICWIRKAALVFGATTPAVSTVLAIFFGGLALGSYLFGRVAQRTLRPLTIYAWLLVAVGFAGLASPMLFAIAERAFGWVRPAMGASLLLGWATRAGLISLLLLPPTLLMGGTLPLFCRRFVRRNDRISWTIGLLYGANTLGAAVGCVLCGFVLIPHIGVDTSLYASGVLSMILGLLLWRLSGRNETRSAAATGLGDDESARLLHVGPSNADNVDSLPAQTPVLVVYGLFFLSGLVLLANEVLWTRYLSLLARNTVYTYTSTITVILLGMVVGSVLTSRFFDRTRRRAFLFGLIQILTGLTVLTAMFLPATWWREQVGGEAANVPIAALFLVLLLPAVLSGVTFPLAIRMVVHQPALAGLGVGVMGAVNTVGGIVGALIAGFVALPLLGLERSVLLTTGTSVLIGLTAWLVLEAGMSLPKRLVPAIVSIAVWLAVPALTGTRLPADFLATRGELVEFREGLHSNLAVLRSDDIVRLEIDRLWQGENRKRHQIMAAHVPALLHPEPRRVLVIGTGTGQTAERFLMHNVERLDCVDIEPELIPIVMRHFDADWMADQRVGLIVDDGRSFLKYAPDGYDIISVEVGQVFRPSVASFYTVEFYREARRRLNAGGLICQFAPIPFFAESEFRAVVRTFIEVFPVSVLWYNTAELLLIGTSGDRITLRGERLDRIETDPLLREDMAWAHWGGPEQYLNRREVFLGGYLTGSAGLQEFTRGAAIYRDDRPVLEYVTARHRKTAETEVVERLRASLEPFSTILDHQPATAIASSAALIRDRNLRDIVADAGKRQVADLRAGRNHREAVRVLNQALQWNPENLELNLLLADELITLADYATAQAPLERALAIHEGSAKAQYGLGHVLHRLGRLPEAIRHYSEAARLDPDNSETHNNLGAALAQTGEFEAAQIQFAKAVEINPNDAGARENLAKVTQMLEHRNAPGPP